MICGTIGGGIGEAAVITLDSNQPPLSSDNGLVERRKTHDAMTSLVPAAAAAAGNTSLIPVEQAAHHCPASFEGYMACLSSEWS